jgi:hypothetical protein
MFFSQISHTEKFRPKKKKFEKKLLRNFVEKPGFSLSMRAKQLKIAKSAKNLVIYNLYILLSVKKTEKSRKKSTQETRN